jgi:ubiquinone/menaquinone biosynthesis C-methylase UbiE
MPSFHDIRKRLIPSVEHHQNRYARELADAVPSGCRWLDIGAGTRIHDGWIGPSAEDVAARAALLVGSDLLAHHLRENALLSVGVVADAQALPFASESFDVVTANMLLEHLATPDRVFGEVSRVLRPGGRFIFVTPNRTHPAIWFASVFLSRPVRRALARLVESRQLEHVFYTYYRANTPGAIRRLLRPLPLRARRLERFSSYPFFKRPWPAAAVESAWIRTMQPRWFDVVKSNLLGNLEKTAAP